MSEHGWHFQEPGFEPGPAGFVYVCGYAYGYGGRDTVWITNSEFL
jgi:hypothetical protein